MNSSLDSPMQRHLLALADDQMILAHRNSEWCGHAPILEEDIALANIALDEMGHAKIFYSLVAAMSGADAASFADKMVFFRAPEEFLNTQLVELPRGDWALTMVRQYLFDAAEQALLGEWQSSRFRPLADAAAKMAGEERYHYRHSSAWVRRLGLGTDESHARMQRAVTELWPYALQLFEPHADDASLIASGYVPDPARVRRAWEQIVRPWLDQAQLQAPDSNAVAASRDQHTGHLASLLGEMQSVARLDPGARW